MRPNPVGRCKPPGLSEGDLNGRAVFEHSPVAGGQCPTLHKGSPPLESHHLCKPPLFKGNEAVHGAWGLVAGQAPRAICLAARGCLRIEHRRSGAPSHALGRAHDPSVSMRHLLRASAHFYRGGGGGARLKSPPQGSSPCSSKTSHNCLLQCLRTTHQCGITVRSATSTNKHISAPRSSEPGFSRWGVYRRMTVCFIVWPPRGGQSTAPPSSNWRSHSCQKRFHVHTDIQLFLTRHTGRNRLTLSSLPMFLIHTPLSLDSGAKSGRPSGAATFL